MKLEDALEIAVSILRGVRVPSLARGIDQYERTEAARVLQQGLDILRDKKKDEEPSLFPVDPYR